MFTISLTAIKQLLGTRVQLNVSIDVTCRESASDDKGLKALQLKFAAGIEKLNERIAEEDLTEAQIKALESELESKEKEEMALDEQLKNAVDAEKAPSITLSGRTPGREVEKPVKNSVEAVQAIVMQVLCIDDPGSNCVMTLT